jgi:putative protease
VDIELGGWEEQLILTMTCEDGISVTHTLDGLRWQTTRKKRLTA